MPEQQLAQLWRQGLSQLKNGGHRRESSNSESCGSIGPLGELLFSANVGLAIVSLMDYRAHGSLAIFFQLDRAIKRALGMQITDFEMGYIAYAIASILFALCVWLALHLSERASVTRVFLRYFAGVLVLLIPAAFWLYAGERYGWAYGWPYRGVPLELCFALFYLYRFLFGNSLPTWFAVSLLVGHYGFWFWIFGNDYTANYLGPAGWILGFCWLMVWGRYVQASDSGRALVSNPA